MPRSNIREAGPAAGDDAGFSLLETMVSLAILAIVTAGVTEGMMRFSRTQNLVFNRSAMHDGVRSATELLQQEVGQAGSIALPQLVRLGQAVTASASAQTVNLACTPIPPDESCVATAGMFVGEKLVVDLGNDPNPPYLDREETVVVTAVPAVGQITAIFSVNHAQNAPVSTLGGFATGIVPCASAAACPGSSVAAGATFANGSTKTLLKLYGDVNGNGRMVYVEYQCDLPAVTAPSTTTGFLYRNVVEGAVTTGTVPAKTTPGPSQILLDNLTNPVKNGVATAVPCFTYQQQIVNGRTYVVNVAISLTTQTQSVDRVVGVQRETKSLLNVAPRNVFDAWLLASMFADQRVQDTPASITALLPAPH